MPKKDTSKKLQEQEWSVFFEVEELGDKAIAQTLELPSKIKNQLVRRLNLHDIETLKAELKIERNPLNKFIHISGTINAELEQKCVVTMEPVKEEINEEFEAWFAEKGGSVSFAKARRERMSPHERDETPMLEEEEDPEEVVDGKIDLGELVVQHLSLSLNPYPKVKGAKGNFGEQLDEAPEGTYDNPFAALKDWKFKEKKRET